MMILTLVQRSRVDMDCFTARIKNLLSDPPFYDTILGMD
jgi:hypothetical protein